MSPQLLAALQAIALGTARGERAQPQTVDELMACDALFELGYVNIAPPGWCYRVNEAGRIALATYAKQAIAA